MATTELKVKIDAAINAEPTLKALRELKQLQKETVAGSADYKKIQARINDIGDAAKTAKGQSEDWIDALAGAGGPIGMLGRGLDTITSSTNKFGLALKATGIGLIVALVGQLVAAFSQNEKAMKKLEPIMIAFEQILGGIFAALEPVFDLFIDLAMKALPYVTKGIGIFYSTLFGLYTFIKDVFIGAGKMLVGVFTLDMDLIKEGFGDLKNSVSNGIDSAMSAYDRFDTGTKEMTKTQKKNLKDASDAHSKYLQERKAQIEQEQKMREADLNKQKAEAMASAKTEEEKLAIEKKFAEDSYNSKKDALEKTRALYPKSSQEYKDFTSQLINLESEYVNKKTELRDKDKELAQKAFQDEVKAAQDANKRKLDDLTNTYNLQKQIYGENSKNARQAQDEIFAGQMKSITDEIALYDKKKQAGQELTKEEVARIEELKSQQTALTTTIQVENDKRVKSDIESSLKTAEETKKVREQEFADRMRLAEGDLQAQQSILDAKVAQDQAYYQKLLETEGLSAEQRKKIEEDFTNTKRANAEAQTQIEQKKFEAQQKLLGATASALAAVSDIVGKNTVAGKALAVAASLINTYAAIAGQLAAFAKVPVPAYAIVQAVATGLVGFKAVADIIKTPVPSGTSGGGGAGTGAASGTAVPKPRGMFTGGLVNGPGSGRSDMIPAMLSNGESVINAQSTAMFKPLLSSINAIGGGKRFADGGLAVGGFSQDQALRDLQDTLMTSQQPIKTYVVSSDMSNNQMMDRAIKSRSTL
jgi:chemotaxis protein histidine kinase CheA